MGGEGQSLGGQKQKLDCSGLGRMEEKNVREIVDYSFMDLGFQREKRFDFIVQVVGQVLKE